MKALKIGPVLYPGAPVTRYPQDVPARRTLAAAILLTALALSGCATSKSTASVTSPSTVVTNPATTVAPSTTRPEPTTAATALATKTTSAPTTTPPPTTVAVATATTVAKAPLAITIQSAIQKNGVEDMNACIGDPAACDPAKFTTAQGNARQAATAAAKRYLDRGERGRVNVADPTYVVVRSAGLDPAGDLATATVCMWDTLIVYRPSSSPGEAETIVNDDKVSAEMSYIMVLENGVWLVANAEIVSKNKKENTCPARP
jgi:hypothetical protein